MLTNCFPFPNRMAALNLIARSEPWNFLHAKIRTEIIPEKCQFEETKLIPGNILAMPGKDVARCV